MRLSLRLSSFMLLAACVDAARAGTAAGDEAPLTAAARGHRARVGPAAVLSAVTATGPAVGTPASPPPARAGAGDRTLAPYFHVADANLPGDRLPLKETRASIDIAGVIASVTVHQVFENTSAVPIEAVYVFPASTRAAVHGMRMRVGTRTIEASIEERDEARDHYDAAKREGKRASLLEQERPNVFSMRVANIMPRDRIEVELAYSEMIVPEDGVYELVYPAVVGPRYPGGADPDDDDWIASPYLRAGEPEPYRFSVEAHIHAGVAIKDLQSPSHAVTVEWQGPSAATVKPASVSAGGGGDRDFILRYRLAGDRIESGVLLWDEPAPPRGAPPERFFALLVEPPRRPALTAVTPREYVFLLDVSGSMMGFPLDTAKALMRDLLGHLRATDRLNLVLFSGASQVLSPHGSLPATPANVRAALGLVERQDGGGGTELMGGLEAAYAIPRAPDGTSRTVIVITDGFVGVEAQAFRFIRERLDRTNLFAFGIGLSVNRGLIEGMARAGMGEPFVVTASNKAAAAADKLRRTVESPVLTQVQLHWSGVAPYDVAPQKVPDLLAERPLLVFGKLAAGATSGTVEVTGRSAAGPFRQVLPVRAADARPQNSAVRLLWARKWIELLDDERAMSGGLAVAAEITSIGLSYGLLTSFTSFVAIDSQRANEHGQVETVRQPLPLPAGVPNSAVGNPGILGLMSQGSGNGSASAFGSAYGVGGLGGQRANAPYVIPGAVTVRGSLDKEIIRRIIRRHINEVRFCYEKELLTRPALAGRVLIQFTIAASGDVIASVVQSTTLGSPRAETCMVTAVKRWQFPSVPDGGIVLVSYPFVFTPRGR
jgi:Ca-activated chloride channel family protein